MKTGHRQTEPRRRRRASFLARALLLLAAVPVSLLFAEVVVRIVSPQPPSWMPIFTRHSQRPLYVHQPDLSVEVATGETHFRVFTDEAGHRRAEDPESRDDRPVCLWLGDSFTFGQGLSYEESFVGLVDAAWERFRHVNAGVGGYGPPQYRTTLEDELARGLRPARVLVVTYVGNDFHDCVWSKDVEVQHGLLGNRGGVASMVQQSSHLYRLLAAAYHRMSASHRNPYAATIAELESEESWASGLLHECRAKFEEEIGILVTTARSSKIDVRFVVLPTAESISATRDPGSGGAAQRPVAEALAIGEGLGIPVLNTLNVLSEHDPSQTFFSHDGHLNQAGSRIVADAILATWSDDPGGR